MGVKAKLSLKGSGPPGKKNNNTPSKKSHVTFDSNVENKGDVNKEVSSTDNDDKNQNLMTITDDIGDDPSTYWATTTASSNYEISNNINSNINTYDGKGCVPTITIPSAIGIPTPPLSSSDEILVLAKRDHSTGNSETDNKRQPINIPPRHLECYRKVYGIDRECRRKCDEAMHVSNPRNNSTTKLYSILKKKSTGMGSDEKANITVEYDSHSGLEANCRDVPSCICGIRKVKNNPASISAFVKKMMISICAQLNSSRGMVNRNGSVISSGPPRALSASVVEEFLSSIQVDFPLASFSANNGHDDDTSPHTKMMSLNNQKILLLLYSKCEAIYQYIQHQDSSNKITESKGQKRTKSPISLLEVYMSSTINNNQTSPHHHNQFFHQIGVIQQEVQKRIKQKRKELTGLGSLYALSSGSLYPKGLRNIKNICYLNSILQLLYHIPEIRQSIIFASGLSAASKDNKELAKLQLGDIFSQMMHAKTKVIDTYDFVIRGLEVDPRIQQDAQEFLGLLLSLLHGLAPPVAHLYNTGKKVETENISEIKSKKEEPGRLLLDLREILKNSLETSLLYERICIDCKRITYKAETTPFHTLHCVTEEVNENINNSLTKEADVIGGTHGAISGSTCAHESLTPSTVKTRRAWKEKIGAVTIDDEEVEIVYCNDGTGKPNPKIKRDQIPTRDAKAENTHSVQGAQTTRAQPIEKITLEEIILSLLAPSTIEGFRCEACSSTKGVSSQMRLKKLPNTLIFHLNRFQYDPYKGERVKINAKIDFPDYIDMGAIIEMVSPKQGSSLQPQLGIEKENKILSTGTTQQNMYQLEAIVNHLGQSPNTGHYTYHCKMRKGEGRGSVISLDEMQHSEYSLDSTGQWNDNSDDDIGCLHKGLDGTNSDSQNSAAEAVDCIATIITNSDNYGHISPCSNKGRTCWIQCDDDVISALPRKSNSSGRYVSKDPYLLVYRRLVQYNPLSVEDTNDNSVINDIDGSEEDISKNKAKEGWRANEEDDIKNGVNDECDDFAACDENNDVNCESIIDADSGNEMKCDSLGDSEHNVLKKQKCQVALIFLLSHAAKGGFGWQLALPRHYYLRVFGDINNKIEQRYKAYSLIKDHLTTQIKKDWMPIAERIFGISSPCTGTVKKKVTNQPFSWKLMNVNNCYCIDNNDQEEEQFFVPANWLVEFGNLFTKGKPLFTQISNSSSMNGEVSEAPKKKKQASFENTEGDHDDSNPTKEKTEGNNVIDGFTSWEEDEAVKDLSSLLICNTSTPGSTQEVPIEFREFPNLGVSLRTEYFDPLFHSKELLCPHNRVDPSKIKQYKLISKDAAIEIQKWYNSVSTSSVNGSCGTSLESLHSQSESKLGQEAESHLFQLSTRNGLCLYCTASQIKQIRNAQDKKKSEFAHKMNAMKMYLQYKEWKAGGEGNRKREYTNEAQQEDEVAWVSEAFLEWWVKSTYQESIGKNAHSVLRSSIGKDDEQEVSLFNDTITKHKVAFCTDVDDDSSQDIVQFPSPNTNDMERGSFDLSSELVCLCHNGNGKINPQIRIAPIPIGVYWYLLRRAQTSNDDDDGKGVSDRGFKADIHFISKIDTSRTPIMFDDPPLCEKCMDLGTIDHQRLLKVRANKLDDIKEFGHNLLNIMTEGNKINSSSLPLVTQQQQYIQNCFTDKLESELPHAMWVCSLSSVPPQDKWKTPSSFTLGALTCGTKSSQIPVYGEVNKVIFKKDIAHYARKFQKQEEESEKKRKEEESMRKEKEIMDAFIEKGVRRTKKNGVDTPVAVCSPTSNISSLKNNKVKDSNNITPAPPKWVGNSYFLVPIPAVCLWDQWIKNDKMELPFAMSTHVVSGEKEFSNARKLIQISMEKYHQGESQQQEVNDDENQENAHHSKKSPQKRETTEKDDDCNTLSGSEEAANDLNSIMLSNKATSILRCNLFKSFEQLQKSQHLFCPEHPGKLLIAPDDLHPTKCRGSGSENGNGLIIPDPEKVLKYILNVSSATEANDQMDNLQQLFSDSINSTSVPPYVLMPLDQIYNLEKRLSVEISGECSIGLQLFEHHQVFHNSEASQNLLPLQQKEYLPLIVLQEINFERVFQTYQTCTTCRNKLLSTKHQDLHQFSDGTIKLHFKIKKSKKTFHTSTDDLMCVSSQDTLKCITQRASALLLEKYGLIVDASDLQLFRSKGHMNGSSKAAPLDLTTKTENISCVGEVENLVTLSMVGIANQGYLCCLYSVGIAQHVESKEQSYNASNTSESVKPIQETAFNQTRLSEAPLIVMAGDAVGVKECQVCTFHNSPFLSHCEMCESPI